MGPNHQAAVMERVRLQQGGGPPPPGFELGPVVKDPFTPKPEPSAGEIVGSGLVSGAGARTLGMPMDMLVGLANAVYGQAQGLPNLVKGLIRAETSEEYLKAQKEIMEHPLINAAAAPGGSAWWERQAAEAGLPTVSTVHPTSSPGKIAQRAIEMGSAFAAPGALAKVPGLSAVGAAMPGGPVSGGLIGAGTGAAGEIAAETAGERYRPLGELGAGIVGGGAAAGLGGAYEALPPVRGAAREAAAQQAATTRLGTLATDPNAAAAQIRQEIAAGRQELLPGSTATAPELANDPGLLAAQRVREREQGSVLGEQVREQRAAANEARFAALEGMASPTAAPEETQSYLRRLLAMSDHIGDQETAAALTRAETARAVALPTTTPEEQGAAARQAIEAERQPILQDLTQAHQDVTQHLGEALRAFGGEEALGTPEARAAAPGQIGERMRAPTQAAYDAERQRLTGLREAIDPSGTMGMSPAAITDSVAGIRGNFAPDTFGGMENNFYRRVDGWGNVIPIADAFRLRADINSRLRNVMDHNPQEQLRLLTLKRGIDTSIDDAANGLHQAELSGAVDPGEQPVARRVADAGINELGPAFAADVARAYQASPAILRAAERDPLGRAILDRNAEAANLGATRGGAPEAGAPGAADQRSADDAGGAGLPRGVGEPGGAPPALGVSAPGPGGIEGAAGPAGLTPLTPEARQAFADWNRQYGEMARTFRGETGGQLHAVGKILQKGGAYDSYKLRDDEVPWQFAGSPKTAPPDAVDRFLAATPPEAHAALDDAFAFDLRGAAQNPNGTLNLKAYQKWLDDHQDQLTRRPELRGKFDTAAQAQQRLDDINEAIARHHADFPLKPGWGDAGVLRQFWKPGDQGGESMRRYQAITGGRPEAVDAAADYAAYDFANHPGIIKNGMVVPGAADAWIKQHEQAFAAMPGLKDRFAAAAAAQRTLEDVIAHHQERRAAFTKSEAGVFVQDDPERAIERVFNTKDGAQRAGTLMKLTAADPAAQEGLRRAAIDYMHRRFEGAPQPGGEAGTLKSALYANFVEANRAVLNVLFPGRAKLFDTIAEDVRRGSLVERAKMPGGSDTAELLAHMTKPEPTTLGPLVAAYAMERAAEHGLTFLSGVPVLGTILHHGLAVPAMYMGRKMVQAGRQRLQVRADQLFDQMLLDPKTGADALDAYKAAQTAKGASPIRDRFLGRLTAQALQISRNEDLDRARQRGRFRLGGIVKRADAGPSNSATAIGHASGGRVSRADG